MKKIILLILLFYNNFCFAGQSMNLISDAEIENNLYSFMAPLVKAAGLSEDFIKIKIVVDPSINAFVTNGKMLFINTGLIVHFADDPNVLYGVLAHEIAHIYAGHFIQMRGDAENMSKLALGGGLLGLATALAGQPEAGMFIGAASFNSAQRNMMSYSREHETEADKIAVELLYKTQNNGQGLIKLFKFLSQRDRAMDLDPYMITHPLSNERLASVNNAINSKLNKFNDNVTAASKFKFKRMKAKLEAFLAQPNAVIEKYKNDNYALSIAYFRLGQLNKASNLIDQVLKNSSNDPYLWELKGQFYFESGVLKQAENFYSRSLSLLPNNRIIKTELAAVRVNLAKTANDTELLNSAISLLNQVVAFEDNNSIAYYMLSKAYGKLGKQMKAISALSEFYFVQGQYGKSKILADKVLKMAPKSSKEYLRASDIIQYTKDTQEK
jgi:predicted Zn-dependent protease